MANNDLGSQLSQLTQMKDILSQLPDMFGKLGDSIGDQTDPLRELANSMKNATDTKRITDMDEALQEMGKTLDKGGSHWEKYGKKAALAGAAITGAATAFKTFKAGMGGMLNMVGSLTSSIFNLAKGAVGLLMKTWGAFTGAAARAHKAGLAVARQYEELKETFGSLASNEGAAVIGAFKEIRSSGGFAAKTGIGLMSAFGGEFTAGLKEIAALAGEMGDSFGQLKEEFVENATELLVMNKGLGMTGEALANMGLMARSAGESMNEALTETMQQVTHLEKTFGVDGKLIGKNLDKMSKDMVKFGHMTRAELSATAAYSAKLGVSIETLSKVFDKYENFEDAATGAAKLAEAFGMNVDAMDMMNADSPAEQVDMMRQAFMETGKSLDDLSRQEKAYMAELTGLEGDELYKAFDPANADIGFDEMLSEAEQAAESVTPEEAMLNAAEKIKKVLEEINKESTTFFGRFAEGFSKGLEHMAMTSPALKHMNAGLEKVWQIGYDLVEALFGPDGAFGSNNEDSMKAFMGHIDNIVSWFQFLSDEIVKLAKGGSFEDFIDNMTTSVKNFFNNDSTSAFGTGIANFIADGIAQFIAAIPDILNGVTGILRGLLGEDSAAADEVGDMFGGMFGEAIKKIKWAFIQNQTEIETALTDFMWTIVDLVEAALFSEPGKELMKIVGLYMGALLVFALTKGVIFGIGSFIGSSIAAAAPAMIMDAVFGKKAAEEGAKRAGFFKTMSERFTRWMGNIKTAGQAVADKMKAFADAFKNFGTRVKDAVKPIGEFFKKLKPGGAHFEKIGTKFGNLVKHFKSFGPALKKGFGTVFKKIMPPIAIIIAAIQSLWNWGKNLMDIWGGESDLTFFEKVQGTLTSLFSNLMGFAMNLIDGFMQLFDLVTMFVGWIFGVEIPSISEWFFPDGVAALVDEFTESMNYFLEPLTKIFDPEQNGMTDIDWAFAWDQLKEAFAGIAEWASGIVDMIIAPFDAMGEKLAEKFTAATDLAKDAFEGAKGFFLGSPSKWSHGVSDFVEAGFDDFSIEGALEAGAATAMDAAKLAMNPMGLIETVGSMIGPIDDILGTAKGAISDTIGSVAGGVSSVMGTLSELAPIAADALVTKVASGLQGDGSVSVQHEGLNIQVNFKIQIDSKDLAAALGEEAEDGPFFVINADRGGTDAGGAEAAGE